MAKETARHNTRQWCKSLKCSICIDYYNRPHTLRCGHSFCIGCLSRLVQITSDQNPGVSTNRLKLQCPTCRHPLPGKTIVKHRLTVNYTLQEFVESWLLEQQTNLQNSVVQLRSIGSQSGDEDEAESAPSEDEAGDISRESFSEMPSRYYQCHLSASESETIAEQIRQRHERQGQCGFDTGSESDDSRGSTNDRTNMAGDDQAQGGLRFIDLMRYIFADLKDFVSDVLRCPNRSVMALVWSGYTFSIMMISTGFFPYMLLYSVLFFLILYAESVEQRRANRH